MANLVYLIGRLTKDPDVKPFQDGVIASFTLAVDKGLSRAKKEEFREKNKATADFIPIQAFGKTAEMADRYLGKGSRVGIQGKISVNRYTDSDGNDRTFTSVIANNLEFLDTREEREQKQNAQVTQSAEEQAFGIPSDGWTDFSSDKMPF